MDQSLRWSVSPVHCRGLWTKNQIFWVTPGGYVHLISLSLNPRLAYLSIWGAMKQQSVLGVPSGPSEKHNNILQLKGWGHNRLMSNFGPFFCSDLPNFWHVSYK